MITVPEAVEEIIRMSPSLAEGLSMGIINISSVARKIKPEVEKKALKEVSEGAVIMALNRLADSIHKREAGARRIFARAPNLMVRSNLMEITFSHSGRLMQKQKMLLERIEGKRDPFINVTRSISETTIIAGRELSEDIAEIFRGEHALAQIDGLSSLTVQLPAGTAWVPGVYSFILRALAWEGINVVEVVSTLNELTIILEDDNIDRAFSIAKRIFRE